MGISYSFICDRCTNLNINKRINSKKGEIMAIKPTDTWLTNQELFEQTDFYKKHKGEHIVIRDIKDQPQPKPKWWQILLIVLFGIHLSNRQIEIARKLKK